MSDDAPAGMPNEYFGSAPKEFVPGMLRTVELNWRDALEAYRLPQTWYLIYCQAYGIDPKTWHQTGVQYLGQELDSLRFRTNLSRPNVRQSIMLALGDRPEFQAVATNNDVASIAQVPAITKMIDYALTEAQVDKKGYDAVEADRYFGKGWLWPSWDVDGGDKVPGQVPAKDADGQPLMLPDESGQPQPVLEQGEVQSGAVDIKRCFPWQVVTEVYSEDRNWCIVKEAVSKWELAAQYPELREQILGVDNIDDRADLELFAFQTRCLSQDVVIVRHFYHASCAAVPGGRHLCYLDDIVLFDRKSPVAKGLPIVEVCTMKYFATQLGYPEVSDLVSQQEVLDDVLSQVVNNLMKFGNESLWAEDGVDFDKDAIAEGGGFFTLQRGQQPPQAIQWAKMPEIAKFLLEFVPDTMNRVAGLNATALGSPEGNVDSGTAMALLVNVAQRYQHATQAAYDHALYEVANLTLEFIRTNAENGYAAQVAGVGEQPVMEFFRQEQVASVRRVQIKRRSPMLSEFPVRLEVFNAIKEMPKDQARQAGELLLTGNLDAFTEDIFSQTFLIRWENEQMLQGVQLPAMATDDHKIHNPQHRMMRDKLRCVGPQQDPADEERRMAAINAIDQHMLSHTMEWLRLDPTMGASLGIPPAQEFPGGPPSPMANGKPGQQPQPAKLPNGGGQAGNQPKPAQLPQPAKQPAEANLSTR